jgi:predicted nucleotidyltransferase
MNYGLPDETIGRIGSVLTRHEKVEKAILYGSRAKGTQKRGSDIDLTIVGPDLDGAELARLEDEIDDLMLPYSVDLSIYAHIDNPDLIDHIDRVGVTFYSRSDRASRGFGV